MASPSQHAVEQEQTAPEERPNQPKLAHHTSGIPQRLRTISRKCEGLLKDYPKSVVEEEINAELATLAADISNQQHNKRSKLEDQRSKLLEPQLFLVYVDSYGKLTSYSSSGIQSSAFLSKAVNSLLSALANETERQGLSRDFEEHPQVTLDTTSAQQRSAPGGGTQSKESSKHSKQLKKQLGEFYTRFLVEKFEDARKALGETVVTFCPPDKYGVCRKENGELLCGGACEEARKAMQWPDQAPCVDPRNKHKDYLVRDLEVMLRHYKAMPQYAARITLPAKPATR